MFCFFLPICLAIKPTFIPSTKIPPSQRFYSVIDYSKLRNSIILFGGSNGPNAYNDLWEFSLTTSEWAELSPLSEEVPCNI